MQRTTIANIVSLSRIPLAFLIVLFFDNKPLVITLAILAVLSDLLDGFIAGNGTHVGAIIDPLADKLFVIIVSLTILSNLAWHYLLLFFLRDIFSVIAYIFYAHRLKVKALTFGKLVTAGQFVTLLAALLGLGIHFLIIAIGIFSLVAIVEYIIWFDNHL